MRKILILVFITVFVDAHWLKDIPQTITQSSGQTIQCFATGDQYAHRLHDKDDYTIVLNPVDGDFYYAEKRGEKIQPSEFKVGLIEPRSTNLVPGLKVGTDVYGQRKEFYHQHSSERSGRDAPTSGNLAQLNIFIRFADDPDFPNNREFYDIPFNSQTQPSLRDYFQEVSYGALTVDTYHYPPTMLHYTERY